ncbi:glycosyl hydrolase family 61-domain-containing protein [Trichophaea hybrida]|nr:glycosyl hydrolase family 61-domain-containing protein [Trichophaea hybrida]
MVKCAALLPVIAGLFSVVQAHSRVYSLWLDDVDQGDGRNFYIRSPPSNYPVKDVSKTDIICNVNNVAVSDTLHVNASQKVTFEWYHNTRGDDTIDSSHKGPVTVWIADASTNGAGGVWTKLYESGLENGVWAVQNLIANKGKVSFTLPSSLAPGDYLLRGEIIALHEANTDYRTNNARGAQFYPSCSQIKVVSGGTAKPPGTFGFVGGYSPTDPGILYNIYSSPPTPYPFPAPRSGMAPVAQPLTPPPVPRSNLKTQTQLPQRPETPTHPRAPKTHTKSLTTKKLIPLTKTPPRTLRSPLAIALRRHRSRSVILGIQRIMRYGVLLGLDVEGGKSSREEFPGDCLLCM